MSGVSDDEAFVIHHFAGDVCCTSLSFLDKNTDALSAQFENEMKKSSIVLLQQMVNGVQSGAKLKVPTQPAEARAGGQRAAGGTAAWRRDESAQEAPPPAAGRRADRSAKVSAG